VHLAYVYTGNPRSVDCNSMVPVTSRLPCNQVATDLDAIPDLSAYGIKSVTAIGDCYAPGTIATAVYSGHLYARQLDNPADLRYDLSRENYQSTALHGSNTGVSN
jgi:dimethylamine/trimethylamine dehydrogenase